MPAETKIIVVKQTEIVKSKDSNQAPNNLEASK